MSIYQKYFELKEQIGELEDQLSEIKDELMEELEAEGGKKETPYATFSVRKRTYYEYSSAVSQMEEKVRELKKEEEKKGVAEVKSETVYPTMRMKDVAPAGVTVTKKSSSLT